MVCNVDRQGEHVHFGPTTITHVHAGTGGTKPTPIFDLANPAVLNIEGARLPAADKLELQKVDALSSVCDEALESATCRICLFPLSDATQMRCGHFFCAGCVENLFASRATLCPLCKQPASKRGNRSPGIPVSQIVSTLQNLSLVVEAAKVAVTESRLPQDAPVIPLSVAVPLLPAVDLEMNSAPETAGAGHIPCALCPPKVPPSFVVPNLHVGRLRPANPHAPVSKTNPRVHTECAFFASTVYDKSDCFINVEKTVRTSRSSVCQYEPCNRTGASVICGADGCEMRYHYVCAVKSDCAVCNDGSYTIFCNAHRDLAPQLDMDEFALNQIDADGTQGRETADECFICGKGGNLLLCDGSECPRAYHVVCAGEAAIPEGTWFCGICRGQNMASVAVDADVRLAAGLERKSPCAVPSDSFVDRDYTLSSSKKSHPRRKPTSLSTNKRKRDQKPTTLEVEHGDVERQLISSQTPIKALSGPVKDLSYKRRRESVSIAILPTALSEASVAILKALQKRHKSFRVSASFSPKVTHVLSNAFDANDVPRRTVKLCKGIVSNIPIVCLKWLDDAFSSDVLPSLDDYLHPLSRSKTRGPLFDGHYFQFGSIGGAGAIAKQDLMEIVKAGNGSILAHEPTADSALCRRGNIYLVRVKTEASQQGSRRQSQVPSQVPPGCTLISPEWILDECTRPSLVGIDKENESRRASLL